MVKRRPDTDVTFAPEYNFQSFSGTVWKTKGKVALGVIKSYTGEHRIYLLSPQQFDPTHPQLTTPPGLETVITVLPAGTRLRIERLMKDNGMARFLMVTVSLEDGVTAAIEPGKVVYLIADFVAKNRFIWAGESDSKEWGVDPDLLEKTEPKK
jgi:hypothetical protein